MDTSLPCTVYTSGYRSLSPCSCILTSRLIYCSQYNTTYIIIYMILLKFVFVQLLLLLLLLIVIILIYFCCTVVFLCSPLPFLFLIQSYVFQFFHQYSLFCIVLSFQYLSVSVFLDLASSISSLGIFFSLTSQCVVEICIFPRYQSTFQTFVRTRQISYSQFLMSLSIFKL